jgi:hypothetical protein
MDAGARGLRDLNAARSAIRGAMLAPLLLLALAQVYANDAVPELGRNEGFVIIDTDVERRVTDWVLNANFRIQELPRERQLQIVRLRAGRYQWRELNVPHYDLPHRVDLGDDARWSFTVKPGTINYFGTLFVAPERGTNRVDVRLVNRSAEVYALMQTRFPAYLTQLPLRYTGWQEDAFLELIDAGQP